MPTFRPDDAYDDNEPTAVDGVTELVESEREEQEQARREEEAERRWNSPELAEQRARDEAQAARLALQNKVDSIQAEHSELIELIGAFFHWTRLNNVQAPPGQSPNYAKKKFFWHTSKEAYWELYNGYNTYTESVFQHRDNELGVDVYKDVTRYRPLEVTLWPDGSLKVNGEVTLVYRYDQAARPPVRVEATEGLTLFVDEPKTGVRVPLLVHMDKIERAIADYVVDSPHPWPPAS